MWQMGPVMTKSIKTHGLSCLVFYYASLRRVTCDCPKWINYNKASL